MDIRGWFEFKGKSVSSWAFSFHRITGIVLLIYLCLHLVYLSSLVDKTGKMYQSFVSITVTPTFLILDVLLVLCGLYHGINGVRVILHEFGYAHEHKRILLTVSVLLILVLWFYSSYVMYNLVLGD